MAVKVLQELVGGELDRLVAPFGGPVLAGDQPGPVHATEVAGPQTMPLLAYDILSQANDPKFAMVNATRSRPSLRMPIWRY